MKSKIVIKSMESMKYRLKFMKSLKSINTKIHEIRKSINTKIHEIQKCHQNHGIHEISVTKKYKHKSYSKKKSHFAYCCTQRKIWKLRVSCHTNQSSGILCKQLSSSSIFLPLSLKCGLIFRLRPLLLLHALNVLET